MSHSSIQNQAIPGRVTSAGRQTRSEPNTLSLFVLIKIFIWEFVHLAKWRLGLLFVAMTSASVGFYWFMGRIESQPGQGDLRIFFILFLQSVALYSISLTSCRDEVKGPLIFGQRFFLLPVRTPTLVLVKLSIFCAASALLYLATAGAIFLFTGNAWPLWAPSLFAVTLTAWIFAIGWAFATSVYFAFLLGALACGILYAWVSMRFGAPPFHNPVHMWQPVWTDAAILSTAIVAAAVLAVVGVHRDRRRLEPAMAVGLDSRRDSTENFRIVGRSHPSPSGTWLCLRHFRSILVRMALSRLDHAHHHCRRLCHHRPHGISFRSWVGDHSQDSDPVAFLRARPLSPRHRHVDGQNEYLQP